jgi:hypothetical protein
MFLLRITGGKKKSIWQLLGQKAATTAPTKVQGLFAAGIALGSVGSTALKQASAPSSQMWDQQHWPLLIAPSSY